jgi:cellulose synthase (UDP-forming)
VKIRQEIAFSWLGLGIVFVSLSLFFGDVLGASQDGSGTSLRHSIETTLFVAIVVLLVCGNLVYQFARLGYLRRRLAHQPTSREALEAIYDGEASRLGILIPSYKEERRVLLQTILSVALMEYPLRRVAVLLDDPPRSTGKDLAELNAARTLITELNESFAVRARALHRQHLTFMAHVQLGVIDTAVESCQVAQLYDDVASYLDVWTSKITGSSAEGDAHTDRFFIENILQRPAREHRARAAQLRATPASTSQLAHEYRRLVALLTVEIRCFERKRYVNLSHAPNKAMNLNSYIGLIGRCFREVERHDGTHLEECSLREATFVVPPVDYLLTIDADSIVLPDYALRLVQIMEDDFGVAVAQTPYSAFPGAPRVLERVAGATTDIQYIVHQGFTSFNATYWVGANALLRLTAVREICSFVEERGHQLPVFIQDRTVIEDTGSTIDLIQRGWRLHNYPERLAYSATPPDFGSLLIQRRRWSNGGLIILPNLLKHMWRARQFVCGLPEMAMRAHYLISPAVGNLGLLFLLFYRFDDSLNSVWLPLSAAPYYVLYGRDLRQAGYSWADLFRVYALNFVLIPVNLAGVLQSVQQAITGKKAAFGRTPKVQSRTLTPPLHVVFQWLLLAYLALAVIMDLVQGHYSHAIFAFANCVVCVYGITNFLGWRTGFADMCLALPSFLTRQHDFRAGTRDGGQARELPTKELAPSLAHKQTRQSRA